MLQKKNCFRKKQMKFEYEYVLIDTKYPDKSLEKLNVLGSEGWDAIYTLLMRETSVFILLKRSIPGEEDPVSLTDWIDSLPEEGASLLDE